MTRSRRRKLQRMRTDRQESAARRTRGFRIAAPLAPALLAALPVAHAQQQGLEEIIVTAQKREESMQSVPVAIQALGSARLQELNVSSFEDYVRFLPSVSFQTFGPGFAQVYMRGVVSGGDGNHSGSQPSVGIYLDEQPITTIQGALDVHMYDIERVEALAGPQGTLFGASSQSGTLRIITNKPDPDAFAAGYGLEGNYLSEGDAGYLAEGFVNLPLSENAAVRLVGWARHDAGFIDNVAGTRTYPTSGITVDNSGVAKDDYNDVDTFGARAALRLDLNESWTVTPALMAQRQEANGTFGFDPNVGDLEVSHLYPDTSDDKWVQAALTVEGKLANLDVVYAGAYLDRDVETDLDYSDYSFWYDSCCAYGNYWYDDDGALVVGQYIQGQDDYSRQSHEIRLSSAADQRLRFTAGLFYQRQEHGIEQNYKVDNLAASLSVTGWEDTLWLTQQDRVDVDYAVFGELYYDITDKLTATAGLRYFWTDNSLKGFFGYGAGYSGSTGEAACTLREPNGADGPDFNGAPCLNLDKSVEEDDYAPKFSLSYKLTDDKMVYATYAEGFRPGGINRRGTLPPYLSDWLTSYELGWKTTWADNRLRFNGAFFMQNWDDFQFSLLGQNGLTEIKNAAEADINGVEADVMWAVTDGLSLTAAVSWLDSELGKPYCGYVDPNTNRPVATNPCPVFDDDGNVVGSQDPEAPKGTQLPVMPEFKGNLTARYAFPIATFDSYVQGAVVYVGERRSDLRDAENSIVGDMGSYTTVDLAAGLGSGNWKVELYVANVADERGELFKFAQCAEAVCGEQTYVVTTMPRTFGLRFNQDF